MARPLRIEFEGALYHLTGRGNARQRIFADDPDCAGFVQLLVDSLDRYQVSLHGYVLMGNHYHLVAETARPNLSRWMHWLTTAYTVYFNRRHRRVGHLFQSRYKSIVVEAEGYCLSLSRYVHLNPVRGRMLGKGNPLQRRKRLRAWRWSSYRGYSGLARPDPWMTEDRVLDEMGGPLRGRRMQYRRFVEEGLVREIENPLDAVQWQAALGRENFVRKLRDRLNARKGQHCEVPSLRWAQSRPEAEAILEQVAKTYGCTTKEILKRGGKGNEARAVAMVLIWDVCGVKLREIGELFGGTGYTAVAQMIARTREKDRRKALRFRLGTICGK